MKIKGSVTVEFEYDVPDERVQEMYLTTDPRECAKVDKHMYGEDPVLTMETLNNTGAIKKTTVRYWGRRDDEDVWMSAEDELWDHIS